MNPTYSNCTKLIFFLFDQECVFLLLLSPQTDLLFYKAWRNVREMKFTLLKNIVQGILTNVYSHVTTATINLSLDVQF